MTYHEYLIVRYEDALFALLFYEMTLFNETNQINMYERKNYSGAEVIPISYFNGGNT